MNISMIKTIPLNALWALPIALGMCLLALLVAAPSARAITALPTPDPIPGSYGIEATKQQPPPEVGASIATPGNGASFTESPITVNGICPDELLVQIYNNNVMVGAVLCENGAFSLEISLFAGINELTALVFDDLEQSGPVSNLVSVNYSDDRLTAFGQLITLTSTHGRRSAPVGNELSWPLQLSGGTGPYAFSIDWGDGSAAELKSQSLAGTLAIAHKYKNAGIYRVNVKVTDANGVSAFLQIISVASGQVTASTGADDAVVARERAIILWIPAAVALLLLIPTYWLGRRSKVVELRNKMLKDRDAYQDS